MTATSEAFVMLVADEVHLQECEVDWECSGTTPEEVARVRRVLAARDAVVAVIEAGKPG